MQPLWQRSFAVHPVGPVVVPRLAVSSWRLQRRLVKHHRPIRPVTLAAAQPTELGVPQSNGTVLTQTSDTDVVTPDTPVTPTQPAPSAAPNNAQQKVKERKKRDLQEAAQGPLMMVPRPLPSVLIVHTGGTLGMTHGGDYNSTLGPGDMLNNLTAVVPELNEFANLQLKVAFNKDSSRVGPKEWTELAQLLHNNRKHYDAFLVVHGTDTMADTASALSLMLLGFRKPIVLTAWRDINRHYQLYNDRKGLSALP